MIIISWINELISNLSNIFAYVVPGYVFLLIYRYMRYKDKDTTTQFNQVIFHGIVISFVLTCIYDVITNCLETTIRDFLQLQRPAFLQIFAIALGLLAGRFIPSETNEKMRSFLGIVRTPNSNIWDDIMEPGVWLRIWPNDGEESYLGQIKFVEDYGSEPIVVLEYYQLLGFDGEVVEDHTDDPNHSIMLNTKGFKRIEISKNEKAKEQ